MLHNLDWLAPREVFPPPAEKERLHRYRSNLKVFNNDQWGLEQEYLPYLRRISTVITNFGDYFQFPVLFNYQRLMSVKMADLICGELPIITGDTEAQNKEITKIRDNSAFDTRLYSTVIDMSRYGDAIWRVYKSSHNYNTFVCWDPSHWFPIVSQDGTLTILQHVLCWIVEKGTKEYPKQELHVQVHDKGSYEFRRYKMDHNVGTIGDLLEKKVIRTGLSDFAVFSLRSFATSDTVYGSDDYMIVDSILAELMVRVAQISTILDRHADPALTGPVSMLKQDEKTGRMYLETGKFYAVSQGEEQPKYLTWDGRLESAFKQIELLINQLYIISEMGAALLGEASSGTQAVSGTAFRFKMVNPLAKARRITNGLSLNVRQLFALMSEIGYKKISRDDISIEWSDGLPDDPRENVELVKLITGAKHIMPLELAIVEHFRRTNEEAKKWLDMLSKQELAGEDPNKPGPQDGTGVNPQKHGSDTGLKSFQAPTNK